MRYSNYICILLFLCFGCKNITEKQVVKSATSNPEKIVDFIFLDSIRNISIQHPFQVPRYHKSGRQISRKEFKELHLKKVFSTYNDSIQYKALATLQNPQGYKILLFGATNDINYSTTNIVTYDKNYNLISTILVNRYHNDYDANVTTYMHGNSLFVETTTNAIEHIIDKKGVIEPSKKPVTFKYYRYLDKFHGYLHEMPKRTVKAKSGLIVRDSSGKAIGKLSFGETAYIIDYTKDSLTIKDEGKTIKAPRARIILHPKKVTQGEEFYIETSNIGYVFSGFLFENYTDTHGDDFPYAYTNLQVGTIQNDVEATIDLRELFEIKRIDYNDYVKWILESSELSAVDTIYKKGKVLTLPFENGEKLILKDTTYQAEYTPTRSYNVMLHDGFPDAFLVRESMFFTDDLYSVLSQKTGDTLQQFRDYPHMSPSKKYTVAIFTEFECMQDTYVVVNQLKDNKYQNYASFRVQSWSYPYKLDANNNPIDEFLLHWISDTEFIVYAKNPEECYMENPTDYFYLKYSIK